MLEDDNSIVMMAFLMIIGCVSIWMIPNHLNAQSSSWTAPDEANQLENPLENSEKIISAGKQIFSQLCAVCHGKTGKGDGITASALNPKPADLTSKGVQEQSDGAIYWKIREGRPPMPAFENQLSEQQVWAIVHYIRSLHSAGNKK